MTYPNIEPDQTEAQLIILYEKFYNLTGIPPLTAGELLFHAITPEQRDWIKRFVKAWETMREKGRDWMQYAKQKTGLK